jgi:hypothetical protein
LKQFIAAILLIAFATQTFSKGFMLLDYYANTAAYQKNCVNKNNPRMHCCGRCQLRKKLQQEDNSEKQNPEQRGNNKNESPISSESSFAKIEFIDFTSIPCKKTTLSSRGHAIDRCFDIFHPPQA